MVLGGECLAIVQKDRSRKIEVEEEKSFSLY